MGISSRLLGEKVRFDGGHKRDAYIVNTLGQFFQWVPACPEMDLGLGTPRESLRLVGTSEAPHLVATCRSRIIHHRCTAAERLTALAQVGWHGHILKKDSPSCGMSARPRTARTVRCNPGRVLDDRIHAALATPASGRRGTAPGHASARKFHYACVCLLSLSEFITVHPRQRR